MVPCKQVIDDHLVQKVAFTAFTFLFDKKIILLSALAVNCTYFLFGKKTFFMYPPFLSLINFGNAFQESISSQCFATEKNAQKHH